MSDLETLLADKLAQRVELLVRDRLAAERESGDEDWRRLGAVSIARACKLLDGLSRSSVCRMLDAGELTEFVTPEGGRRLVTVHSIRRRLKEV